MHNLSAGNAWWLAALMTMMITSCGEREEQRFTAEDRSARLVRAQSRALEDAKEEEEMPGGVMGEGDSDSGRATGQYAMKSADSALSPAMSHALKKTSLSKTLSSDESALSGGFGFASLQQGPPPSGSTNWGIIGSGAYGTLGHGAAARAPRPPNTESYKDYGVNDMTVAAKDHVSTFSIDVDTASYSVARRKILQGSTPPPESVRVEEFVNYFHYDYAPPATGRPLAVHMDAAPSPFAKNRYLMRVGVQAKKLSKRERKPVNLVFLVDVSGSMASPDKLGLAKSSLRLLVDNLRDSDRVAIVTYAGSVGVALEPTGMARKSDIIGAINGLFSGGSTAMDSGLELAYEMAARGLRPGVESRVIVLSDGDANVGNTSHDEILKTIAGHVKEGVTLSTIGFGMGNYKDVMMEQLANKGNGNYFYIDDFTQARRVFQEQLGSMLEVVAKDVKIQVDFDPDVVREYRLVGYENRDIADRDFRNDRVDAGEVGPGHTVTALYEVVLAKQGNAPLAVVRVRAKQPRGERAREWVQGFDLDHLCASFAQAPRDFRFAVAVMGAAEILRGSRHARSWSLGHVIDIAQAASTDGESERREFVNLMEMLQPKLAMNTR